jgi:hypothetical protein
VDPASPSVGLQYTTAAYVARVLKLAGWKGFGLPQPLATALFNASATTLPNGQVVHSAGGGEGNSPPTHVIQVGIVVGWVVCLGVGAIVGVASHLPRTRNAVLGLLLLWAQCLGEGCGLTLPTQVCVGVIVVTGSRLPVFWVGAVAGVGRGKCTMCTN